MINKRNSEYNGRQIIEFELLDEATNESIECVINYTQKDVDLLYKYKFINCIILDVYPLKIYINELTIIEKMDEKITKTPENILNISKMVISKMEIGSLKELRDSDQNFAVIKAKIDNCEIMQNFIKLSLLDGENNTFVVTSWDSKNFMPFINSNKLFTININKYKY